MRSFEVRDPSVASNVFFLVLGSRGFLVCGFSCLRFSWHGSRRALLLCSLLREVVWG